MNLNEIWYLLVGVLFTGYAILDGFDLGVGVLSLFSRNEEERHLHLNAIGPFWDGNEVWLITGGGALFAAFPVVYATVFSAYYLALVFLLVALIFRAVSIEFYGHLESSKWRACCGRAFGVGSLLTAILLGIAFGNILRGLPIDSHGNFTGSFLGLLNPYALLVGLLTLVLFVMHGAIYLALKTDGELRERMRAWARHAWFAVAVIYVPVTLFTILTAPFLFVELQYNVLFYLGLVPLLIAIPSVSVALTGRQYGLAFVASAISIASMMAMAGVSLFPRLVPSRIDLAYSLTIYNASSTPLTLKVMLIIALTGVPMMLLYTACIYWVFRGKTKLSDESY